MTSTTGAGSSSAWTAAELDAIDQAGEITIASRRSDHTLRPGRIVWSVRNRDAIYVRSVNGPDAAWYRGVQTRHTGHLTAGGIDRDVSFVEAARTPAELDDALDEAYRAKYGSGSPRTADHQRPGARNHTAARPRLTGRQRQPVRSHRRGRSR